MVIITLILLVLLRIADPEFVKLIRLTSIDLIHNVTYTNKTSSDIMLLDINEASLQKYGQWPWPRDVYGNIIEKLKDNGAKTIVLTVFFPEKDRSGKDKELVEILQKYNDIIIAQSATNEISTEYPDNFDNYNIIGQSPLPWLQKWKGLLNNIPTINDSIIPGMSITKVDIDGNLRKIPLLVNIEDHVYPSISLEIIKLITGSKSYSIKSYEYGVEGIKLSNFNSILTDKSGRIWIDYGNTFDRIQLTDKDWSSVKDKHVFVGVTIAGVTSTINTLHGPKYNHYIHAATTQTLLNKNSLRRESSTESVELLVFIIIGIIMIIITPYISAYYTIPIGAAYSSLTILYGYIQFNNDSIFDISYPVIAGTIIFLHLLFNNYMSTFAVKKLVTKQFQTYLSPALVERLKQHPDYLDLEGINKEMTFLFTDIRGFTTISEHYKDDHTGLVTLLNRFLTPMTWSVLNNYGHVDKYMGDSIMAFWNDPVELENQKGLSIKTALDMVLNLKILNKELQLEGIPKLNIGIGINTGFCSVGNVGSLERMDYSVTGDAVNLASRIEGQTKEYRVPILLGENVVEGIDYSYFVIELDRLQVKGKEEPVTIYTVLGSYEECKHMIGDRYNHKLFLKYYREQNWEAAKTVCFTLKNCFNGELEGYYDMMFERIIELSERSHFPQWDGAYTATSK
jgi:adenylate cyclase